MKRNSKKCFSIILSFAMMASSFSMTNVFSEAKAKLTKTKISMKVGQKKTITIKGKVKKATYRFTTSSKKTATVSSTGVVSAKKAGKVTIIVKEVIKKKSKKIGEVRVTIAAADKGTKPVATATPTAEPTATPEPTKTPRPTIKPSGPTPTPFVEAPGYEVPKEMFTIYKPSRGGEVEAFTYPSTVVAEGKTVERRALVALPPNYKKEKKYPVVYACHGFNMAPESLKIDGVPDVTGNAIAEDVVRDMIVVLPNLCADENNGQNIAAYDNFINDLTQCLMPAIEEHYSVLTGRENTAICGFSMGGRASLQIGLKRPDLFGYIGAFCPAPGVLEFFPDNSFRLPEEYVDNTLILIVKGSDDNLVAGNPENYYKALLANNTPAQYYIAKGGHGKQVYLHGYYNLIKRAFPKQ